MATDSDLSSSSDDRRRSRRPLTVRMRRLDCEHDDCATFLRELQRWEEHCALVAAEEDMSDQQAALAMIKACSSRGRRLLTNKGLTEISRQGTLCRDINFPTAEYDQWRQAQANAARGCVLGEACGLTRR